MNSGRQSDDVPVMVISYIGEQCHFCSMKHSYFLYFLYFLLACSSRQNSQNTTKTDSSLVSVTAVQIPDIDRSVAMPVDTLQFYFGTITPGSITCVISDEAYLMADSLLKNKTGITLHLGDEVRILANKFYIENQWEQPVSYVSVKRNSIVSEGYVSLTDLAVCKKTLSEGNIFLLGLTGFRKNKNDYSTMWGKAIIVNSMNKILSEKEMELIGGEKNGGDTMIYGHGIDTDIKPSSGLKGVVNVIDIGMHYDACGYTNGDIFLLWDGKQMHYVFKNFDNVEAGLYANYSDAIFPSNAGGKENKILSVVNIVEYDGESDMMPETTHDSLVVQYGWVPGKGVILEDTIFEGSQLKQK
jgi:hypothetical protein